MKLDIVLWPHPVLLGGTEPITQVDDELRAVVAEMRRVLFEQRGVGLAAPQVGIARRLYDRSVVRNQIGPQMQGVVEKSSKLDFSVAENIRVRSATGLVLRQKMFKYIYR